MDPTFEFERRRNVPVKYNREKWTKIGKFIGVLINTV